MGGCTVNLEKWAKYQLELIQTGEINMPHADDMEAGMVFLEKSHVPMVLGIHHHAIEDKYFLAGLNGNPFIDYGTFANGVSINEMHRWLKTIGARCVGKLVFDLNSLQNG
jgi:hypothetical protein